MQSTIRFEQVAGLALMLLFLTDIFLTVLYARAGTGLLAPYWNRAIWALFRAAAGVAGRGSGIVLSLAGPVIVVALIVFWATACRSSVAATTVRIRQECGCCSLLIPLSGRPSFRWC